MFKASANESARASIGHFSLLIHFVSLVKYGPLSIDTSQIGPNCRFSKDICDRSYMKYMLTTQLTSFLTMWINPGERSDPINKLPRHLKTFDQRDDLTFAIFKGEFCQKRCKTEF